MRGQCGLSNAGDDQYLVTLEHNAFHTPTDFNNLVHKMEI